MFLLSIVALDNKTKKQDVFFLPKPLPNTLVNTNKYYLFPKPLFTTLVDTIIEGGSDSKLTNYGYAFKKRFKLNIRNGYLHDVDSVSFKRGFLEDENKLLMFCKKNSSIILSSILSPQLKERMSTVDDEASFNITINIFTDNEGVSYINLPEYAKPIPLDSICFNKTKEIKYLISNMNFVNSIEKGGFFPRYLQNNNIYRSTSIKISVFAKSLEIKSVKIL